MIRREDFFETSIYRGELTKNCIAENTIKLKKSFPALSTGFFDMFYDRIKAHNYTDERLKDAIGYVIDNCVYPTPTIAQFISFDKRMKLYTYDQMLKLNDQMNFKAFKEYKAIRFEDNPRPMYASLNDIENYKLELWNKE